MRRKSVQESYCTSETRIEIHKQECKTKDKKNQKRIYFVSSIAAS